MKISQACFFLLVASVLDSPLSRASQPGPSPPAGVFHPWDGRWRGRFIIYSPRGDRTVIETEHVYRSRDDLYQEGVITDRTAEGAITKKKVVNWVENSRLHCRVYREDGSLEVEHEGFFADGAILWSSRDAKGRLRQFFRERVIGDIYTIDGFGIYGAQREIVEIYVGRYKRLESGGTP